MFHNLRPQPPPLNPRPQLLRHRRLPIIALPILPLRWQINIYPRALTRKHLRCQTLPPQVNTRAIHLVQQDRRHLIQDLHGEGGAFDHVYGRDERVEDKTKLGRGVDGDCVGFAVDAEGGGFAFCDEDGVVDFRIDL